ncbi:MAG: hypothetical protein QM648_05475 [Solirubrobacterales bacterium]
METNTQNNSEFPDFDLPAGEALQIIGNPEAMMSGRPPVVREMTLDDLDDDCWACRKNRKRILAGNPPTVLAFD